MPLKLLEVEEEKPSKKWKQSKMVGVSKSKIENFTIQNVDYFKMRVGGGSELSGFSKFKYPKYVLDSDDI